MGKVRDDLEREVINSDYLVNAPFEWLTISLRFGLKNEDKPHYQKINKSYGDLPLAIELDAHELRVADESELQVLLTVATLKALIHAGNKYDLPVQVLEERLDETAREYETKLIEPIKQQCLDRMRTPTTKERFAILLTTPASSKNHIQYDSVGNVTAESDSTSSTLFKYNGKALDATSGNYWMRARWV